MLVDQPSPAPSRKVLASTLATAAAVVVGGLLARFVGSPFDAVEVLAAWPVLGAFVGGYFARERASDQP